MKTLSAILMALALAVLPAVPALAGGGTGQDMVTKTFKLTLKGNVPADRDFGVFYFTNPNAPQAAPDGLVVFCGPKVQGPADLPTQVVSNGTCKGNGTVYAGSMRFKRGTTLYVQYVTLRASDPQHTEDFYDNFKVGEKLDADRTNSAYYSFGNQQPSRMPATGAGGRANTSAPVGAVVVALSLLVAGGYAARRHGDAAR